MTPTILTNTIEADRKAKCFEQELQSQFIRDRDIIRDLEQQRDKLDLNVVELKRQIVELQKTQSILKRKMSENKDQYHDTILNLKAKVKKNVDTVLKIGISLQRTFMLGPKPMSFCDSKLKHGLGYANPYTLKKAISQNPKLYDASCLDDSKIHMNVRDTEDILEDATKSQIKIKNKMKDPIAIQKKQNLLEETSKWESIFYTSLEEIWLNDFCQQLKPILHELQLKLEIFQKRFLRDIKEMKDVFESTESDLSETWKQIELLKDQLLEATLENEIECCVLLSHKCVDNNMQAEIEKVQRDSIEIQEGMQKRINILENDV
ncbi:hypothetical protein Tco_1540230 [Tanacetum coccineum]